MLWNIAFKLKYNVGQKLIIFMYSILHGGNSVESFVANILTEQCCVKQRFTISSQNYILRDRCWTERNIENIYTCLSLKCHAWCNQPNNSTSLSMKSFIIHFYLLLSQFTWEATNFIIIFEGNLALTLFFLLKRNCDIQMSVKQYFI